MGMLFSVHLLKTSLCLFFNLCLSYGDPFGEIKRSAPFFFSIFDTSLNHISSHIGKPILMPLISAKSLKSDWLKYLCSSNKELFGRWNFFEITFVLPLLISK